MKKLVSNKYFYLLLGLLFISNNLFSQNSNMVGYEFQLTNEVTVSLPSENVSYRELGPNSESMFNDDFEITLTRFDGEGYEYFPDLSKYIKEMAKSENIKKYKDFIEKNIRPAMNSKFSVYYNEEEGCEVIFGVIQDGRSKVLYEFNLYCFNIDINTASTIINSIDINKSK